MATRVVDKKMKLILGVQNSEAVSNILALEYEMFVRLVTFLLRAIFEFDVKR